MFVVAHNGASIFGGGEIGTALLLQGLQSRGHDVLMLCRNDAMARRMAGCDIPTGVQRIGGEVVLSDAVRFAARLRRLRPEALILTTFKKILLAGLGARLGGVPFVAQRVILSSDTARRATYRIAVRHLVDVVVLNAEAMRAGFLATVPGVPPGRVVTLLDGVKRPVLTRAPGALRAELGIPPDGFCVGTVGRLARQKRHDRLLLAVARLPGAVHCVIAGEGEEREALERLAGRLGLGRRVHLLGFRDQVAEVLAALDVFVIASDREGMANAMLEALAWGVPVVSTRVSGAAEALGAMGGESPPGLLVDFSDEAVAGALDRLLADATLRKTMGHAGAERWRRSFSWDRFLTDWERLLEAGVAGAAGR